MSDIPLAARRRRAPVPASLHSHYEWLLTRTGQPPARLLDVGAGAGHLLQVAGQLGTRHLVGIDRKRRWRPQAQVIDDWLRSVGGVSATQLDDFHADLQHTAHRGDYLFSVNRYVCVGRPTQPL